MGADQWQHRQLIAGHVQSVETGGRGGRGREGEGGGGREREGGERGGGRERGAF